MSGNGMRCLVKFAVDGGIVTPDGDEFDVETGAGVLRVRITTRAGRVTSVRESMGAPAPRPARDPRRHRRAAADHELRRAGRWRRRSRSRPCRWATRTPSTSRTRPSRTTRCTTSARWMEHHALFPNRTNFEVVRVLGRGTAEMRVWERGVGETLSCGSGASAVMVAARLLGLADGALELHGAGRRAAASSGTAKAKSSSPARSRKSFRGTWPGLMPVSQAPSPRRHRQRDRLYRPRSRREAL